MDTHGLDDTRIEVVEKIDEVIGNDVPNLALKYKHIGCVFIIYFPQKKVEFGLELMIKKLTQIF